MFKKNDWIFGLISVAVGVFVLFNIETLRDIKNSMDPTGPAALPSIIAWSMVGIGLLHLFASLYLARKEGEKYEASDDTKKSKSIKPVVNITLASVIFIFLLPIVGYPIAMPLLIAAIMISVGVREKKKILLVSTLTSMILFVSFSFGLKVDLPLGFFESLF